MTEGLKSVFPHSVLSLHSLSVHTCCGFYLTGCPLHGHIALMFTTCLLLAQATHKDESGQLTAHSCWLSLHPQLLLSLLIFESQSHHWLLPTLLFYFIFSDLGVPCLLLLQLPGKHPVLNSEQSFMPHLGMCGYSVSSPYPVGAEGTFGNMRWGSVYDFPSLPIILW